MSESVQSLVLDINYQNVKLHNDDTVLHLDNVDKDIPYIFSALPLRALLYSKMIDDNTEDLNNVDKDIPCRETDLSPISMQSLFLYVSYPSWYVVILLINVK